MNVRQFYRGKAIGFLVVVVLLGVFVLLQHHVYNDKQTGNSAEPQRATLAGTYECLPLKGSAVRPATEATCEPGLKTDGGEHYAVNFFLMSQMHAPLEVGQRFSAQGVVTDGSSEAEKWQQYELAGVFSVTDSLTLLSGEEVVYECDGDAMLCPDGSSVGRQGPSCEFAACHSPLATTSEVTTYLGGSVTGMNVTVSPQEVISDSRCPATVQCVWAGTVEVRTILSTQVSHGEHILTLGEPQTFGDYTVTLTEVTPAKTESAIAGHAYRFTYLITRN